MGIAGIVTSLLASIPLLTAWTAMGKRPTQERQRAWSASKNFVADRQKFINPLPVVDPPMGPVLIDWIRGGQNTVPENPPPVAADIEATLARAPMDGLRVTWMGHSTALIELDGIRVLTDPVWGERTSPWQSVGPKRFHRPPIDIEALPELDAVVISHDHYDHLDATTIPQLIERTPVFLVPLGVGAHLEHWGVPSSKIVELDWWDEHEIAGVRVVATPARHFSGRAVTDRDATLWASWSVAGPRHRVFFSGDTGMFPGFSEIGERLGPFDVAMIESGAYNRQWADVHLGPEQALQAFIDLRGQLMMPIHWGTFDLALHAWTEPVERILAGAAEKGIAVAVPRAGESVEPSNPPELVRWWPEIPWQSANEHPVVSSGLEPKGGVARRGELGADVSSAI